MTYDRKVVKFDAAKLAALHRKLIQQCSGGSALSDLPTPAHCRAGESRDAPL